MDYWQRNLPRRTNSSRRWKVVEAQRGSLGTRSNTGQLDEYHTNAPTIAPKMSECRNSATKAVKIDQAGTKSRRGDRSQSKDPGSLLDVWEKCTDLPRYFS
jgi:hypothetical protein